MKRFPLQASLKGFDQRTSIPWELGERAHAEGYTREYPGAARAQDTQRIADRGGFGNEEMDTFLPGWRALADALDSPAGTSGNEDQPPNSTEE